MLTAFAFCAEDIMAQNTFPASGRAGIYTTTPVTSLQVLGGARFGTATQYANIDSVTGNLSFGGNASLRIGGNRYAFQYSGDPDYGLFFNSTNVRYEFRDGAAIPVFYVNANTGAGVFSSTVTVGAYTFPATDGANNQVLKTNGAGALTWSNDNNTTYTAGTGLNLVGTTFSNTAPDQVVALSGSNGITIAGAYPNFTINGANFWRTNGNAGLNAAANFLGTTDAIDLVFRANNIEGMRLTSTNRRLGLGTTIPTAKLHINAAAAEDALRVQTNGTTRLFVSDAGGVSIGTTASGPVGGLYVAGNTGIGTAAPESDLHVLRASAGVVTANANAPLVIENSTSNYINLLTPDANEKGILFGDVSNASDGGIIYNSSNSMQFRTNGNTTRMTLNSLGDLTINGDLSVLGSTVDFGSVEQLSDIGANLIGCNSDFVTTTDGANSLGTSANTWFDVWATDATINTSDAREKTNIKTLDYGLKEIMKLRAVRFNWKKIPEAGDKIGVIAQEVQKILPEVVRDWEFKKDETTGQKVKVPAVKLGIMYDEFIPVLIRGMQQQQEIIEEQNKKIDALTKLVEQSLRNQPAISAVQTSEAVKSNYGLSSLRVIPNPARSSITVEGLQKAGNINIIDMQGRSILRQAITGTSATLNISTIPNGTYIIQYINNGKTATQKFVKE